MLRTRTLLSTLAVSLAVALGAASCSAGDDQASDSAGEDASGDAGDQVGSEGEGGAEGAGDDATADGSQRPRAVRSLLRTAEVSMTVDDVAAAADDAVAAAVDAGGFQSGGSLVLTESSTGFVELRVPADRFEDVLADVSALGEVADRTVAVEDVSDVVVDLDGRIAAAAASVDRVRGFLAQTTNVTELAAVEAELTSRESQLESLLGEQRQLTERVDLATITVRFGEEVAPALVTDPEPSDDIPGFLRALRYGWVVLVTAFQLLAAAVGFLLPFVVIGVPGYLGGRALRRRFRKVAPI